MNKKMYDLAALSIKTAKSAGADDCRVSINSERLVEISYREHNQRISKKLPPGGLELKCS